MNQDPNKRRLIRDNETFQATLRSLIDGWCDRRALCALRHVLGPYSAFNGLTDGWAELRSGLRNVKSFCDSELTEADRELLADLILATDHALERRG
jgi:hypothetical protein